MVKHWLPPTQAYIRVIMNWSITALYAGFMIYIMFQCNKDIEAEYRFYNPNMFKYSTGSSNNASVNRTDYYQFYALIQETDKYKNEYDCLYDTHNKTYNHFR
jgi:hypothetical protein